MIIIEVAGGLGNQLQQYALYRKFISLGKEAKLDISWFDGSGKKGREKAVTKRTLELDYFEGLDYDVCTAKEKIELIGSDMFLGKLRRKLLPTTVHWFHENRLYHPEVLDFESIYLSGYFACEKYYRDILPVLREKIRFPRSDNPLNEQIAQEMKKRISVSVHLRRGDYLSKENEKMFGNICTDAYYEASIQKIKEVNPKAHFYLFSDDIPYVKQRYKGAEFTVVDINQGVDSFYDMWLMSKCKHNICANSTFSFWGARLNPNDNKIMIRPTIHKNTQTFNKNEMSELWKGWRFISPEGEEQ